MTGIATATATATAMTEVLNASRATYKGHGQPTRFYYWGTGKDLDAQDGALVTEVTTDGHTVTLVNATGNEVRTVDVRTRFWTSPAPAEVAKPEPTEDAKAIVSAAAAKDAKRPSRNAKLTSCRCGCKAMVRGLYRQGHDARHASQVAAKVIAAGSDADLAAILAELPTEPLRIKAANIVAKRIK